MNANVKLKCRGEVRGCSSCRNTYNKNGGFCTDCGRPLNKAIGDTCGNVIAQIERGHVWNGKVKIKCKICKTINVV